MQRSRNEDFEFPSPHQDTSHRGSSPHLSGYGRDPSPELARISPLVTRPPKIKHASKYSHCQLLFYYLEFLS